MIAMEAYKLYLQAVEQEKERNRKLNKEIEQSIEKQISEEAQKLYKTFNEELIPEATSNLLRSCTVSCSSLKALKRFLHLVTNDGFKHSEKIKQEFVRPESSRFFIDNEEERKLQESFSIVISW